jgi:hypothetical protein
MTRSLRPLVAFRAVRIEVPSSCTAGLHLAVLHGSGAVAFVMHVKAMFSRSERR